MGPFAMIAVAFCFNAFTDGPMKSLGPFFIRFQEDLRANAGEASLTLSVMHGSMYLVGPLSSMLSNRFGCRATMSLGVCVAAAGAILCSFSPNMLMVQITSMIIGMGVGFATVPSFALVGARFKEKRSLANNVMTMGSSLIAVGLSPLVQLWIDAYTWRGTMLLLSTIYFNAVPCGLLLTFGAGANDQKEKTQKKKIFDLDLLKSFNFVAYVLSSGFEIAALTSFKIYLVRFAQSRGVDDYLAAALVSVASFIDMAIRPISGYFTSLSHIGPVPLKRTYVFCAIVFAESIVAIALTLASEFYAIAAVTVAYSICYGCRGALPVTITADLFGVEKLVNALGLRYLAVGIFSAIVPPLVGALIDYTGSYNVPFYACAVLFSASGFLVLIIERNIARKNRRNARRRDSEPISFEMQ